MDVVTLGELLIDLFPAETGRRLTEVSAFLPKPGGAPANVAVATSRLGKKSAFIGKVGDDAFGHHLADVLHLEGVDVSGIRFDPHARTSMAFIAMPDPDHSEFLFYRNPGADMMLKPDEVDPDLMHTARVFHFGSLSLIQEPSRSATLAAIDYAREGNALISFDVNYRPLLWSSPQDAVKMISGVIPRVDLVKLNEVEAALLGGYEDVEISPDRMEETGKLILSMGIEICILTLGPEGSYFHVSGSGAYVPGFKVHTIDATGCGDAFIAGLLCRLSDSKDWRDQASPRDLEQALTYANAVGALTSLKKGVIPALPTADEVEAFLHGQP